MYTSEDKYSEMRSKLREGLQILKQAPESDQTTLGMALLKLHSALEDYLRLEIAARAPSLREKVEDVRESTWKVLLEHCRTYLNYSESDCDTIGSWNSQRLKVAHGRKYSIRRFELVEYARFVHKRVNPGQPFPDLTVSNRSTTTDSDSEERDHSPTYNPYPRPQPVHSSSYDTSYRTPWYRSTLVLFITFFLVPPLWAVLIVTDRNQGCFAKGIAYLILIQICLMGIGYIYVGGVPGLQNIPVQGNSPYVATRTPSASSANGNATQPFQNTTSSTSGSCTIVWAEDKATDLGGKNRSMVWEEVVASRVRGSGMMPSEFYDLVIQHNPDLVADGYEFKKGKTYVLPECQ